MNKKLIIAIVILPFIIAAIIAVISLSKPKEVPVVVRTFEECVAQGNPILETYPEQCRTADGVNFIKQLYGEEITVTGEIICLPHLNASGPQTLECAFGIKDINGKNYGIRDENNEFVGNLQTGSTVTITGILNSAQDDPTNKYDILGVIVVASVEVQ